jgi:hypothetical protein
MIIRTVQQSPCQIALLHIKGHQDDKTPYNELPLDAQLKCDADHEAVYHQMVNTRYWPIVPRLPLNGAQLHIDRATINSSYKTAIRNAFTEPALLNKIQTSNKQNSLGWRQLFHGRMSLKWARLEEAYLHQIQTATDAQSGTLWTTNIITTIWKSFFTMWQDRSTDIHRADSATCQVCHRRQAALALHHKAVTPLQE